MKKNKKKPNRSAKEANEIVPSLSLSVRNLGPIAEAENIEIKPLTILVGPNGSGKTYFATFIYSLHQSLKELAGRAEFVSFRYFRNEGQKKQSRARKAAGRDLMARGLRDFPADVFDRLISNLGASSLHRIARKNARPRHIAFEYKFQNLKAALLATPKNSMRRKNESKGEEGRPREKITQKTLDDWCSYDEHMKSFIYLPAGRAGLMNAATIVSASLPHLSGRMSRGEPHLNAIVASFLEKQTYLAAEAGRSQDDFEITRMSIRRGDDLEELFAAKSKNNSFVEELKEFESSLFNGHVSYSKGAKNQRGQLEFKKNQTSIPLSRSSSMVQELASFFLIIDRFCENGDTIIIDEPEAHLHPVAQKKMAEGLITLVDAGLKFIVTSHSPIFLEHLGNLTKKRPALAEKTAVYNFQLKNSSSKIRQIKFDLNLGYLSDEFADVYADLFNEF